MGIVFKNKNFVFKKLLKSKSKDNVATWHFEGDISEIAKVKTSCGCTSYNLEPGIITANYTAGNAGAFTKSLKVFLNDGKPEDKYDEKRKMMLPNPDKEHIVLTLSGTIS